jgi:hypothetical protein
MRGVWIYPYGLETFVPKPGKLDFTDSQALSFYQPVFFPYENEGETNE